MRWIAICLFALFANLTLATQANTQTENNVDQFIQMMVQKHHFEATQLSYLKSLKPNQQIINKITHPYEAKPWHTYRRHFVTDQRIQRGLSYWQNHSQTLARAEKKYGVPASVIVAIIGVESNYGHVKAGFGELDALYTLAFHYPSRQRFFKRELEQFLVMCRQQGIAPQSLRGSYAGALGIPQFMPSSYRHYGVDFDNNGHVDLLNNHNDAIGSIANYLKRNGWQRHQPIAVRAHLPNTKQTAKPGSQSINQYIHQGITPSLPVNHKLMAELIKMGKKDPSYWLAFKNFDAIMSYNPRHHYAMAVFQLSEQLKQQHDRKHAQ